MQNDWYEGDEITLGCEQWRKLVTYRTDFSEVLRYLFAEETDEVATAMSSQFAVFEMFLNKRGRGWTWRVCTTAGDVVMWGSEGSRHAANYKAYRALFLLLQTAPYRLIRLSNAKCAVSSPLGRSHPRLFRPERPVQPRLPGSVGRPPS